MKRTLILLIAVAVVSAACTGGDDAATSTSAPPIDPTTTSPPTTAPTTTVAPTTTLAPTTTTEGETRTTRPPRRQRTTTTVAAAEVLPVPTPADPTKGTATRYGVVGCSNTDQAVRGYTALSSKDLLTDGDLGGGSAAIWGDPGARRYGIYWGLYDERRPAEGYDGAWVQICLRSSEHGSVFDTTERDLITHIVSQIHLRDPGIPVWVSPLNFYTEGHVCTAVGADGPVIAAMVADWAAGNLVETSRGPDLGPLGPEHIGVRDDCHPNERGELLLGEQLVAFAD